MAGVHAVGLHGPRVPVLPRRPYFQPQRARKGDVEVARGVSPDDALRRRPCGDRVRATPPVPINSAPFPELWRGFWSVMTPDYYNSSANSAVQIAFWVPSHQSVYYGSRFKPPTSADLTPDNPADPPPVDSDPMDVSAFAAKEEVHPHLMFRSSIRDPELNVEDTPVRITPASQLLLRAALAAVNTEDLRDADDDVSSHLIELRVFPGRLWPENGD